MWELYGLLGTGKGQKFLIDEVAEILKTLPEQKFKQSLKLMFGTVSFDNSAELAILFIRGLKFNQFFVFQEFVEKLHG